jgi:histone-lysine N-methyltransferase SETD2
MECVDGDCNCGEGCKNQRFQRKQFAKVSVITTEKKGFGLRADADLQANDFIFEYIGEVINEPTFRRRMLQYDDDGIKHFYFMSLTKSEFVDATKKGNLGRFCNHSCNPNCYVDKWVVGEKLRMGIFAGRKIKAGEELVFNYNVDRYGADPQPCYCGEPNCTGYIGGKTQTERSTKLPIATMEALGIDDGDGWDTVVAKRPRKKKPTEDDEDYVNSLQPRGLEEDGVTKVMAALMQCKEKWIVVKLLARIQKADDDRVRHRVVRMHGYQILKSALNTFIDDTNVVLQILDILYKFPRLTKNKISDSNIEATIENLTTAEHEDVSFESKRLLEEWSKLETAYRIPRKKFDPSAPAANSFEERRNMDREEDTKPDPFANIVIPKGPRSNIPQRNASFFNGQRPARKPPTHNLPAGWFVATDKKGAYYYYNKSGVTTWKRPTAPATDVPKGPSKAQENQKALQDIIDSLTKEPTPRPSASQTPQQVTTPVQEPKKEKWRSLPIEKQMKIYENTVFFPPSLLPYRYWVNDTDTVCDSYSRMLHMSWTSSDISSRRMS